MWLCSSDKHDVGIWYFNNTSSPGSSFKHCVAVVESIEKGKELKVSSQKHNNEGYGVSNILQWKVNGLKKGVKYTVVIEDVRVGGDTGKYSYWFKLQ